MWICPFSILKRQVDRVTEVDRGVPQQHVCKHSGTDQGFQIYVGHLTLGDLLVDMCTQLLVAYLDYTVNRWQTVFTRHQE